MTEKSVPKVKESLDFVDIYGSFGRWHLALCFCCALETLFLNWHALGYTFISFPMDHWCARPPEFANLHVEEWKNRSIPMETRKGKLEYSQCFMYDLSNFTTDVNDGRPEWKPNVKVPCSSWEFNSSFYQNSISSQFNLVCGRSWLISLSQSVFMAGILVAVFGFGQIADKIGRRPVIIFTVLLTIASGFGVTFAQSYPFFAAMRFFVAMGSYGAFTTTFVILMEVSSPQNRPYLSIFMMTGWATGFLVLPGIAFLTKNWFYLTLIVAIGTVSFTSLLWVLPESPRWLLTQRKFTQAKKMLEKAAKANRKWTKDKPEIIERFVDTFEQEAKNSTPQRTSIIDCVKTPNMRKKSLICFYAWFVTSFVYYGLALNTGSLGGSPFVTFAIFGAAEFPSLMVSFLAIKYVSRRLTLCLALLMAGLCCLATIPVGDNLVWLRILFAMLGKCGVGVTFCVIYIFTAELFPTVVRSVGVGTSSTMARAGAIIAPFVKELGKATSPFVPMAIFGGLTIVGAFLVLFLPETMNQTLPDTIEQGELFGKKPSKATSEVESSPTQ